MSTFGSATSNAFGSVPTNAFGSVPTNTFGRNCPCISNNQPRKTLEQVSSQVDLLTAKMELILVKIDILSNERKSDSVTTNNKMDMLLASNE